VTPRVPLGCTDPCRNGSVKPAWLECDEGGSHGYRCHATIRGYPVISRHIFQVFVVRYGPQKYFCTHATPPCPARFLRENRAFLRRMMGHVRSFFGGGGRMGTECRAEKCREPAPRQTRRFLVKMEDAHQDFEMEETRGLQPQTGDILRELYILPDRKTKKCLKEMVFLIYNTGRQKISRPGEARSSGTLQSPRPVHRGSLPGISRPLQRYAHYRNIFP